MASILGVGQSAHSSLSRVAIMAAAEVARLLSLSGLGAHARIHGSGATKSFAFIDWSPKPIFAGDVDVLLFADLSPADRHEMQSLLTRCYRDALGANGGTHSRVSIKCVDDSFRSSLEARGLLHSALYGGIGARQLWQRPSLLPHKPGRVCFPYALPYATWRWLGASVGGPLDRAIGLYELAKGVSRRLSPVAVTGVSRIVSISDLTRYLRQSIDQMQSDIPPLTMAFLGRSIAGDASRDVQLRALRLRAGEQLQQAIRVRMANSILVERVHEADLASAA